MSSPKRLCKAEEVSTMDLIESFLNRYAHILLPILIIVLLFLIIALVMAVIDITSAHNTTVVMVESGNYYNHLKDII